MDIPTIPGAVYSIASSTSCDVTDKASGKPLGTATPGSPVTTPAYSDAITLSDPDALYVQIKTFNFALAALGLLGGGSSAPSLPSGYLAAEFLENQDVAYIQFSAPFNNSIGVCVCQVQEDMARDTAAINARSETFVLGQRIYSPYIYDSKWYIGWNNWILIKTDAGASIGKKSEVKLNYFNDIKTSVKNSLESFSSELTETITENKVRDYLIFAYQPSSKIFKGKIYYAKLTEDNSIIRDFIPCINETGKPCFYEKVSREPFYAKASNFVVGVTLTQALNLSKLPATGGTLTISLPTGYDSDAGVMSALETARAHGWTLTVQTYTPEAESSSVATFGMRRVWVRRTQDENGMYVDADGTRWQVDWCVDILTPDGSTPDAHGYELFRSVDAAVEYWELAPYVDPESENLLTETNENE